MALDVDALETSFDLVARRGDEVVDVLYARLFETAPALRQLFAHTDMHQQHTMLLSVLVLLRRSVRDLGGIVPTLRLLGARHAGYGAQAEHYPVVGHVLIGAIAEVAGDAWTPEHQAAWTAAFDVVAEAMLEGAREAQLPQAA